MIKKLGSRLLSAVVALTMLMTMLPATAFAADDKLDDGTYIVTANLYVPAEHNTVLHANAYLTNTVVPPLNKVYDNAKLSVVNGVKTLVIDSLNATFTLQSIDGCTNAEILKATRDNVTYSDSSGTITRNGRITDLEIKLGDDSGTYVFSNCKEFPTLMGEDWIAPLTLEVDFDSAVKVYTPSDDAATATIKSGDDVSAYVESTTMNLDGMSLTVNKSTENADVTAQLTEQYDSTPEFAMYELSTTPALTGNTQATISITTSYTGATVYRWQDNSLTEIESTLADGKVTFTTQKLGTFVVFNTKNNYKIEKITYPTIDGISYEITASRRYLHKNTNWTGYIAVAPRVEDMNGAKAYTVGFKSGDNYLINLRSNYGEQHDDNQPSEFKLTVPAEENQQAWFITKNSLSGVCTAAKLSSSYENGNLSITIGAVYFDDDEADFSDLNKRLKAMAQYLKGSTGEYVDWGYVLITDKNVVNMPSVNVSYLQQTYSGKEVSPWQYTKNPDNVIISGTKAATKPGKYTAVLELPEGNNCWGDGVAENKSIDWEIKKQQLVATYAEKITEGQTPTGEVTIKNKTTGNKLTDNDYTLLEIDKERDLPTVTIPEQEYKVGIYSLDSFKPALKEGAQTSEYFEWAPFETGALYVFPEGTESVGSKRMYPVPENNKKYTYTGKLIQGISEAVYGGGAFQVEGDWQKDEVGTYTATITPAREEVYWSDGTRETKTITWSIVKNETPVNPVNPDKDKTVTANLYVAGKDNSVIGFNAYLTNGNNPNGEDGYEKKAPTEPVEDNATVTIKNGKATLSLDIPNPVFTLQKIGTTSTDGKATITDSKRDSKTYTSTANSESRNGRITHITVELDDTSGTHEYVFEDCEEFPTLLGQTWNVPLRLHVKFGGGSSGLDSKSDVDTGKVTGGSTVPTVKADVTVKVKDDTATVSKINTDDLSSKNSITLDVTDGNKGVTGVNLPVSALEKIVDAKVPGTTLTLSDTSAKFDLAALTEVTKAASGKTVDLRILTGSDAEKKFSAAEKSAMSDVKNASAVSVALSSDDKAITSLGSGKLTVSVPYKWDGKGAVRAYQVDANGKLVSVPVTCKNNVAELTLTGTGNFILGTVDTKSFDDVADDAFYKTAVDWAVENGVTSGVSDTLFAPDKTCTRAQVVTFLWRASGSPEPTKTENPFTDVKSDAYYYKAVLWALEKGITSGTSATTFAPDAVVSRAQVVTFQWRMAGSPKATGTNNFTDVPADSYYKDAVQWAAENGITSGTSSTTFAPNAGCTRGQIVTFLYRQLGK